MKNKNRGLSVLGLIPARGGSKRVPNKNIRLLKGRPLISYTVAAARNARSVQRVVVSTDSPDIAAVATCAGAQAPFLRPKSISQSSSTELQFLDHALKWLESHDGYRPDLIAILYPTSPFRTSQSIDKAVELLAAHPEADSLRSIRLCSEHPYKMWEVGSGGYITPFIRKKDTNTQTLSSQLFPTVYIQNASIYITKPETINRKRSPIGDIVVPFIMDEFESVDINTEFDFTIAEFLMAQKKRYGKVP